MAKIRPHNKLIALMRDGKVHTVDSIGTHFASDEKMTALMYRLSTYIYDIRKYEQGIIKVAKDGRKVAAYQLINASAYTKDGFLIGDEPETEQEVEAVEDTAEA